MAEIVGRDGVLAALRGFFEKPFPAALLIEGEAGIGKTTIWREAVREAKARGYRVLSASPTEGETRLPFAALGDLLGGAVGGVLEKLPMPQRRALGAALLLEDSEGAPPDRRAVSVAVVSVLGVLAAGLSVVLAVDDLQWVDADSRNALEFAFRRLGELQIGLLLARRSEREDEPLPLELQRTAFPVSRMSIGGLSLGATGELLREQAGLSLRRPTLLRIHEASGGNPLFALGLASGLTDEGESSAKDELPLPRSLRDVVRERIGHLPQDTIDVLRMVAALSEPDRSILASAAARDVDDLLRPALEARVVEFRDERITFTHPLLRSAVYGEAALDTRRELHSRLAELDLPLEERARHLALSTDLPDADTADVLESASRSAGERGAPEAAAELAEHAARLTPTDEDEDRHRRNMLAAQSIWAAGDYDRGRGLLERTVANAPSGTLKAEALLLLAKNPKDVVESRRLCESALAETSGNPALRTDILLFLAQLAYVTEGIPLAINHSEAAVDVSRRAGDTVREGLARGIRALLVGLGGGGWNLAALKHAAEFETNASKRPVLDGLAYSYGLALCWTDNLDDARRELATLDARGRDAGDVTRAEALSMLALAEHRSGAVAEAEVHLEEAIELARQFGLEQLEASVLTIKAEIDVSLGRVEEARRVCAWLDDAAAHASEELVGLRTDRMLGMLELSLGNAAAARKHFEHVLSVHESYGMRDPCVFQTVVPTVEAALATNDLGRASELAAVLADFAAVHPRPRAVVHSLRGQGLVEAARGNLETALTFLSRAVEEQEALPVPFERALNHFALGRVQRQARERRAARESLSAAAAIFEELGCRLWLERVREELGRIGGRTRSPEELTETERRVATLVAKGRTNKEVAAELVVTVRAVEANLSRIYTKLGIRSRSELAGRYRIDEDSD